MINKEDVYKYSRQNAIGELSPWFEEQLSRLIVNNFYPTVYELQEMKLEIIDQLQRYADENKIRDIAIGISGGVDSALTAALFHAAGWRVLGVIMPIHQNPDETARGIETCEKLGIEFVVRDLTTVYDQLLPKFEEWDPEGTLIRRGNLRVRLRMMTVYNEAARIGGCVGSTDNFSELAAGFWTLHGDVGDIGPIQTLNKSWEVPKLAEMMGVPQSVVEATPTDGLGISKSDEDQFGFSYLEFDIVLQSMCHLFFRKEVGGINTAITSLKVPEEDLDKVKRILKRIKGSIFKRNNPFNLVHPTQPKMRGDGLKTLDHYLQIYRNA